MNLHINNETKSKSIDSQEALQKACVDMEHSSVSGILISAAKFCVLSQLVAGDCLAAADWDREDPD